ncbi:MAG: GntR family transcriptional regulator [Deltaproteobacteria bacterium]|nr:GntR family transcriptional regulator [Deltaproteobacteria bacterium]
MTKTLTRMTLRDQAEKALREMIAAYRFTPGTWINVDRLAKDLGVSRTPVCQALDNLEKNGFVTRSPGRGFRMALITLEMARDLYVVRGRLEGLAGRLAAKEISSENLAQMQSLLEKQRVTVLERNVVAYSKLDFKFHGIIYDACGNWILKELLENIKSRARPFVCDLTPILQDLLQDHVALFGGLKAGDSENVEMVLTEHNLKVQHHIERALGEREDIQTLHPPDPGEGPDVPDFAAQKEGRAF